jgi:hypothetical protein
MTDVRVQIQGYADSDDEERAELAWRLEREIRRSDVAVEDVRRDAVRAPDGAKGAGLEWAELVLSLVGTLSSLMSAVLGWRERNPGVAMTVEIDGDKLEIEDVTGEERSRLVEAFLSRHGAS